MNLLISFWQFISNIGLHDGLSAEEARRIKLQNRITFVSIDLMIIYLLVEVVLGVYDFIPYLVGNTMVMLFTMFLMSRRKYMASKVTFVIMTCVMLVIWALMIGPETRSDLLLVPFMMIPIIVFKSKRLATLSFLVTLLLFGTTHFLYNHIDPIMYYGEKFNFWIKWLNYAIVLIASFVFVYYFRSINEEYETEILEVSKRLDERNREITDSIKYARRIQHTILPDELSANQLLPDSFVFYKPKDIVSGDFYWIEQVGSKVLFAAIDCTGHGVPGAFVSIVGKNGLTRCIKEFGLEQPAAILDKLSEIVEESFNQSSDEVKDGMDIALCSLDIKSGVLEFSGANNPLYMIRAGELTETKADKQPIGKYDHRKPFNNHCIQLEKGDELFVFSDGFPDQFGGPKGKKYKYKNFKELLQETFGGPMKDRAIMLNDIFETWKGDLEQVDDVCIIGVKY